MQKTLLGLDIGSHTIKAVQISRDAKVNTLLAAGFIATPQKALSASVPSDEQVLANSINRLVHDMKITSTEVSLSLSSLKVINRVIEVPEMKEEELSSSIQWEAEQYIPLPLSKVKIDYAVISRNSETKKMKLLLVAAPIDLVEKYMRIATAAGLTPVAMETEILAVGRSIAYSYGELKNIIIISMGANTTDIGLIHNQVLVFTKSYPIGGNTLTKAIAEELGFDAAQAEEYKKTYGMEEDKLEGKIAKTLTPFFNTFYQEIEKNVSYFKEEYPKEEIKTAVVSGGGAKLPGLVMAITRNIGLDSQMNNPFTNLSVDPKIIPALAPDASIYSAAVGLALKEI